MHMWVPINADTVFAALKSTSLWSEAEDLAKKLSNPVAALISVPVQANYDENYGVSEDGEVWRVNIQPVIPVSISEYWNPISKSILPIIKQQDFPATGLDKSDMGE